jgi:hypothetical protein
MFSITINKNDYKDFNNEIPHTHHKDPDKEDNIVLTLQLEELYKKEKLNDLYLFLINSDCKGKIKIDYDLVGFFHKIIECNVSYNVENICIFNILLDNVNIPSYYGTKDYLYVSILANYLINKRYTDYKAEIDILTKPEYVKCVLNKLEDELSYLNFWKLLQTGITDQYIDYFFKIKKWSGIDFIRLQEQAIAFIIDFNLVKTFIYMTDEMKLPIAEPEALYYALAYGRLELADEIYRRLSDTKISLGQYSYPCHYHRNYKPFSEWFNKESVDWLHDHNNNKTFELEQDVIDQMFRQCAFYYNTYLYDKIVVHLVTDVDKSLCGVKKNLDEMEKEPEVFSEIIENIKKFTKYLRNL